MSEPATQETTKPLIPIRSFFRLWWVNGREGIAEWYRLLFHTILVSLFMFVNLFLAFSSFLIYLGQWKHTDGGPEVLLTLLGQHTPNWIVAVVGFLYVPLDHDPLTWFILVLNLPIVTWLYSTNTQPITKGFKTIISWKSRRGRVSAALLSAIAFMLHFCALFAWYIERYLFDFFAGVTSDKEFLIVKSMASFGYILMSIPVALCVFGIYRSLKEFHMNADLRKMFFKWEFSLFASQSFSLRNRRADVIVGYEKKTNKPIVLHENSRYIHELVVGATGTGKTSTTILQRVVQDLIRIARGKRMGVVILEPKGDLVMDVLKLCDKVGIPNEKIQVVDPTDLVRSVKFNPFMGPLEAAAETFRGVLDALAGDQDEFFKGQQAETASLYTMLGKIRYGNMFSILHMQRMYTDPRYLADMTIEVRKWTEANLQNPDLSPEDRTLIERYERVVSYFENDVLEYKTYKDKEGAILPVTYSEGHKHAGKQVVENKKDKFVTGAKKYINDICMNAMLSQLMVANDGEEALDIDAFLRDGGVLVVNTALGVLEELSLSFGQFFIRQFQSSVFRRPPEENGFKRFPVFFYIDEFPLYANQAFERMLTLGRSYKVGSLIAVQSLGQLQNVSPGYDRTILANASNKTVFGRGEVEDNEVLSKQFGEEYDVEESLNESVTPVTMPNQSWGYRYNTARELKPRFTPTEILEQEFKHFIVQLVEEDGSIRVPVQAYGKFITETKFVSRFLNIGEIELETKKYKSLKLKTYHLDRRDNLVEAHKKAKERAENEEKENKPSPPTTEAEQILENLPESSKKPEDLNHQQPPVQSQTDRNQNPVDDDEDEPGWELPPFDEEHNEEGKTGNGGGTEHQHPSGRHLTQEEIEAILNQPNEQPTTNGTQSVLPTEMQNSINKLLDKVHGYSLSAPKNQTAGAAEAGQESSKDAGSDSWEKEIISLDDLLASDVKKAQQNKHQSNGSRQEDHAKSSVQPTGAIKNDDF